MTSRLAAPALAVSMIVGAGVPLAVAWTRPKPNVGSLVAVESSDSSRRLNASAAVRAARSQPASHGSVVRVRSARLADRAIAARSSQPTRILIPSLSVSTMVVPVGVAADGETLEIPSDVHVVGWYRFGPAPGEKGSSVLVGHVDARDQGPGAFFGLQSLAPRALVAVRLADGRTLQYRVLARRSYVKGHLPNLVFARGGAPVLALVTCGGSFDETTRHYSDNVVVFAVPLKE